MSTQKIIQKLKNNGYRITKARRSIIELFSKIHCPVTVQDVREELGKTGVHIDTSTVYRELDFLESKKIIKKVILNSTAVQFESALKGHHHHLICTTCETILPITSQVIEYSIEDFAKRIKKEKNFDITQHTLEFYGTCSTCAGI